MFRKEKKVSKSQHLLERIHFFKLVFFSKRHQKQYFLLKIGKLYICLPCILSEIASQVFELL